MNILAITTRMAIGTFLAIETNMPIVTILAIETNMAIVIILIIETVIASSQSFWTRIGYPIQVTHSRGAKNSIH